MKAPFAHLEGAKIIRTCELCGFGVPEGARGCRDHIKDTAEGDVLE